MSSYSLDDNGNIDFENNPKNAILLIIFFGLLIILFMLIGCKKQDIPVNNDLFSSLVVNSEFDWSLGKLIYADSTKYKGTYNRYPELGTYYYQIYEDQWPSKGDYDFNDVVLQSYMIYNTSTKDGTLYCKVIRDNGGYSPHNVGFEILKYTPNKLFYLQPSKVNINDIRYIRNNVNRNGYYIDDDQNTVYFSSVKNNDSLIFNFSFTGNSVDFCIQPFISIKNDRSKEIHVYGYPPSDSANLQYFNTYDDISNINRIINEKNNGFWNLRNSIFYASIEQYPWGIELISDTFYIPIEKTDILFAYPMFKGWVESNGEENEDWMYYPDLNYCY